MIDIIIYICIHKLCQQIKKIEMNLECDVGFLYSDRNINFQ